jgi:PAS domain S-box-containing protein
MPQSLRSSISNLTSEQSQQFLLLSQDLLCILTVEGVFKWLSPAWEAEFGWSLTELIGKNWLDCLHPSDRPQMSPFCPSQPTLHHVPIGCTGRFQHQNGTYSWLGWSLTLAADGLIYAIAQDLTLRKRHQYLETQIADYQQGEAALQTTKIELEWQFEQQTTALKAAIAQLKTEIAERQQVETTLAANEARLKNIAANIPGAIFQFCYCDGTWKIDYISEGIWEVMGVTAEHVMEDMMVFVRRLHPEDVQHYVGSVAEAIENSIPWHYEGRLIKPSGQVRWWQGDATPTQTEEGIRFCGVVLDISDRKLAEEELIQAKNVLETKVIERTATLIQLIQELEHENQERQQGENQLRNQTKVLEETLRELRNTQAQLVQSEKMSSLGQLVAGVAHEINNPVNFIHGNLVHAGQYTRELLELLQLYRDCLPNVSEQIEEQEAGIDLDFLMQDLPKLILSMQVGAERIRDIVRSLRTFSRLDEAEFKSVDIHDGIESSLMILQSRLKANGNQLEIQIVKHYGELPKIECYAGQLNQVFMNILSNAIDALEERQEAAGSRQQGLTPTITITTKTQGDRIMVAIGDNGSGMPSAVQERLFDPFFTTKPVGKGTGLGLSISYQIITEKHNGALQCVSAQGQGTEFTIEIPIKQTN